MTRTAAGAAIVALLGVFVLITVTVVHARRPLDAQVSRSWDAVIAAHPTQVRSGESHGCRKERLYYYACAATLASRHGRRTYVVWRLELRDSGCWRAYLPPTLPLTSPIWRIAAPIRTLMGCKVD
jgi:hypothetical protein